MKKSLTKKILILSLSALVIAGSGCERRGRAPKKIDPAGGATSADNTSSEKVAEEEKRKAEGETTPVSSDELKTLPGGMNCSVSFDLKEEVSESTFTTDYAKLRAYQKCTTEFGIYPFTGSDEIEGELNTDATPIVRETIIIQQDILKGELKNLVCSKSMNESDAIKMLKDRLASVLESSKPMIDKYDGKLDPSTATLLEGKKITLGQVLEGLLSLEAAVDNAARALESDDFRVVTSQGGNGPNGCSAE
jgi:hypothetical protein